MKFLCPNCKAKYQISDEKIAGRTLKMDCRRCNHPIVIRGDKLQEAEAPATRRPSAGAPAASASARPAPARRTGSHVGPSPSRSSRGALGADFRKNAGAPAAPARPTALDQWHVAINDVPVGPLKRDDVAAKIAAGAVLPTSLVWREGYDDWRPLRDVPELAALLRPAAPAPQKPAFPAPPRGALGRAAPPRPARPPAARTPSASSSTPSRPAEPARPAARGNVVPIGGRLGAAAAPALDEMGDFLEEDEPTRVGATIDFEALARNESAPAPEIDDGERSARSARSESSEMGGLGGVPPKGRRQAPNVVADEDAFDPFAPSRASAPAPAPMAPAASSPGATAPTAPSAPTAAMPSAASAPGTFAAAPEAPAPVAATAVPIEAPRRRGLPVGAWIAIAGAMAFGVALAVIVGQSLLLGPQVAVTTPTPTPAPEVTPPAVPETSEAVPELVDPPPTDPEAETPEATGETETPTTSPGRRGSTGGSSGTSTPRETGTTTTTPSGGGGGRIDEATAERLRRMAQDTAAPATLTERRTPLDEDRAQQSDGLSGDQIRAVVSRESAGVRRCYETSARAAGRSPSVRLDVEVSIGGSGTVTRALVRGQSFGNLTECVERTVLRWRFPATGGPTRTSIPFVFSGQD